MIHKLKNRAMFLKGAEDRIQTRIVEEDARKRVIEDGNVSELDRVLMLPLREDADEIDREVWNYQRLYTSAYEEGWRFFPCQVEALRIFERTGRGFFPIGVGLGKTIICQACVHYDISKGRSDVVALLIPPGLVDQTLRDIKAARKRMPLDHKVYCLGGKTRKRRKEIIRGRRRGLYIFPYSLLSSPSGEDELRAIDPDLIVADEVHSLADRTSARTRRVFAWKTERDIPPRLVGLSGTITSKSIKNYHHLIKWATGEECPLPRPQNEADVWASVLDTDASTPTTRETIDLFYRLRNWAREAGADPKDITANTAGLRKAYQYRLTTSPSVYSTSQEDIGVSLTYTQHMVSHSSPELTQHIKNIRELYLTPNGDEIDHAIHAYKWLYELHSGFYNELVWPTTEAWAKRKDLSEDAAAAALDAAKEHHEAEQDLARGIRRWISESASPGLDTPFLLKGDMHRHGSRNVGSELYELWRTAKDLEFDDMPERLSRAVRVDPFKIEFAIGWINHHRKRYGKRTGALIWIYNIEMGRWLHEECLAAGLEDVIYCPAGPRGNREITDQEYNQDKIVIASIPAHNTGKKLHWFQHQLFLQWPRDPKTAEQVVGRTHRVGQEADELTVDICLGGEFEQQNFFACMLDSLYIQQTTGNRRKIIYAHYDPLPTQFPADVLVERGFGHMGSHLKEVDSAALEERFG